MGLRRRVRGTWDGVYLMMSFGVYGYGGVMLAYALLATGETHLRQYFDRATLLIGGWLVLPAVALALAIGATVARNIRAHQTRKRGGDANHRADARAVGYARTSWDVDAWLAWATLTWAVGAALVIAYLVRYGVGGELPVDEAFGDSPHLHRYAMMQIMLACLAFVGSLTTLDPIYAHLLDAFHVRNVEYLHDGVRRSAWSLPARETPRARRTA